MKLNFESIIKTHIFQKGIVKKAVVAHMNGQIVYISKNWKLSPSDIKQCIESWQRRAQFVTLEGSKYSCLRNEPSFFSGINYSLKSFLVGAVSPDLENRYFILGYSPPKSNGTNAYVDVVRAANQMKEKGNYLDDSVKFGKYSASEIAEKDTNKKHDKKKEKKKEKKHDKKHDTKHGEKSTIEFDDILKNKSNSDKVVSSPVLLSKVDPILRQEVEGFVNWIRDPDGLAVYIQYYLDQNDPIIIAKLAQAYGKFRQVFGF